MATSEHVDGSFITRLFRNGSLADRSKVVSSTNSTLAELPVEFKLRLMADALVIPNMMIDAAKMAAVAPMIRQTVVHVRAA
jgi:hypothetical protein